MKKILAFTLSVLLILSSFTTVFAVPKVYDLSGDLPEGDEANFNPYPIALNATKYAPWYIQYARLTEDGKNRGIRSGDGNQRICSIAISPVNPEYVLAGSDKSGILRSDDGGINWHQVGNNNNGWSCTDLIWSPVDENVAYSMQTGNVGLADSTLKKASKTKLHGVYKTKDAGKTWYQVLSARSISGRSTNHAIVIAKSGNVYALTTDGVFISKDDGENFELLSKVVAEDAAVFTLDISDDEKTMYAAITSGLFRSTDGGLNWVKINGNMGEDNPCYNFDTDPKDENHLYACFGKPDAVYESKDGGQNWTTVYMVEGQSPQVVKFSTLDDGTVRMHIVLAKSTPAYKYSDDYGKTWSGTEIFESGDKSIYREGYGWAIEGLGICESNPNIVFYSFNDNIYKSVDGGTSFVWSCAGFSGINTYNIYFDNEGYLWFCDVDRGLAVTTEPYKADTYPTVRRCWPDTGAYEGAVGGYTKTVAIDPVNKNHILSTKKGVLVVSEDGGYNWDYCADYTDIDRIIYHNKNNNLIYTTNYTSYDNGKTWQNNTKKIMAVSPCDNDVVYCYENKTVYKSNDCGKTWEALIEGISASTEAQNHNVIYADQFDGDTIWLLGTNKVYKCVGNKVTEFNEENGLKGSKDPIYFMGISQDPKDKNHLVTGGKCTSGGVKSPGLYETYDGGETWHLVPGAKGTFITTSVNFSPVSDEVFVGTCSNGFYVYKYNVFKQWLNGELQVNTDDEYIVENQYTDGRVRVKLNGDMIWFDSEPFVEKDRTFVPMRKIFETLGAEIEWDNDTETVTATKDGKVIKLTIGKDSAFVNGEEKTLDAPAQLKNDRTMVPLRFISESLGLKVDWSESNNLVIIKSK